MSLLSVSLLSLVDAQQLTYGLRLRDYARYRAYCSRRLRRIYRALKLTHTEAAISGRSGVAKTRYAPRPLTPSMTTTTQHLTVPLILAERAWAHALALKPESVTPNPDERRRILSRLAKSIKHAQELVELCTATADETTQLEASAYLTFIEGTRMLEKGDDFATALAKFNASRALCEQLQRLTQDAQQLAAYKRRMENLDAPIRFCRYQMQRRGQHTGGSEVDLESLAALTGPAADMLRAQVDAAMGNTNDTTALAPPPSEGNADLLRAQLEAEMDAAATKATAALPRIGACTSTADAQPARHLVALYAAVADKAGELVTVADAAGDRTLALWAMATQELLHSRRVYWLAQCYVASASWSEAYALAERCAARCDEVESRGAGLEGDSSAPLTAAAELRGQAVALKAIVRALAAKAAAKSTTHSVRPATLASDPCTFAAHVTARQGQRRGGVVSTMAALPPPYQLAAAAPLVLDTAYDDASAWPDISAIAPPQASSRKKAKPSDGSSGGKSSGGSGVFGGLFGGWSTKK